ncbi:MAG: AAA family ATPase, partial [Actinomycetota bacterium]|nr:AAA family ATPase [Actinomycetota bacterium]
LRQALPRLEVELVQAEKAQGVAAVEVEHATERRRSSDADSNRWHARADALAQALDAARSVAGVDALAGTEGVLGTLLDLVAIEPGWDAAVEAALGEALQAVVVDGVDRGRSALAALTAKQLNGAVLALGVSGQDRQAPPVGAPISRYVHATRPDVAPLLDVLLADAVVVDGGWDEALDAALNHPSAIIVTAAGDRFGPSGWRLGRAGTGATGAALAEARTEQERSARLAADAAALLEEVRQNQNASAAALRACEDALRKARQELGEAERAVERHAAVLAETDNDHRRLTDQKAEIADRSSVDRRKLQALQLELPGLEAAEAAHHDRMRSMAEARSSLEERARVISRLRSDVGVRRAGLDERIDMLAARKVEVEARLVHLVTERAAARVRREALEHSLLTVDGLAATLLEARATIDRWIAQLAAEQEVQSEAARAVSANLSARRRERQSAEGELGEVRGRRNKLELTEAENRVRLEALTEIVRRELDAEPATAMGAICPDIPDGSSPESRVRELERELKVMGPVNPLAVEEHAELKERYELITGQMDDIKSTKRDLARLIREIDEQIVSVFSSAYADVATNFTELFTTLFPGGKGAVRLTNTDDLLNCGVEIEAKPSGKNVKKLSLLSGGERSLTALGFLFAVFRSRPSPFYVMDEVEAALDDTNLDRFLALIHEFRRDAQLIIVSHQKRTMEAADVLYGVSMKPGGSSKVVSERVGTQRAIDLTEATSDHGSDEPITADAGTTTD